MSDKIKFYVSAIVWSDSLIIDRWQLQNIEDPSLVALGYQLLPQATSQLLDDNGEFDI